MSKQSSETAVRIGPITVMTLLIIIALATLSVLSLTTARAAQTAVSKQDASIQALYENERAAQQFLSELDAVLAQQRSAGASPQQAAEAITGSPFAQGATTTTGDDSGKAATTDTIPHDEGAVVHKVFSNDARTLVVDVVIRDDLTYQVAAWKTESNIDTTEQMTLWQG